MKHFKEFMDQKHRKAKRELSILKQVLDKNGFTTQEMTDERDDESYVYVKAGKDLSFEGIRIYKIGDQIAYRVQKESETHPYGRAYPLEVESMYNDLVSDEMDEEKAGKRVMEALSGEVKKFFEKSRKAEMQLAAERAERKILVKGVTSDYGTAALTGL